MYLGPRATGFLVLLSALAHASPLDFVPVFVVLRSHPHPLILESELSSRRLRMEIARNRPPAGAVRDEDAILLETRESALRRITEVLAPEMDRVEALLSAAGAAHVTRYPAAGMMTADLPPASLPALRAAPEIERVFQARRGSLQLATSVPALGTAAFWNAGLTGQGESIAILDTGVRPNHPAFSGKIVPGRPFLANSASDFCFADDATSQEDADGHGSHVAGIIASQGASGWTGYRGVAPGLGLLYNLKVAHRILAPRCSAFDERDVLAALDWAVHNTPTVIFSMSLGVIGDGSDDEFAHTIDRIVDDFGLFFAVAAGNGGPAAGTLISPAGAYNVVSVANWSARGVIERTSSRGPTEDGRFKPDLAAPGTAIFSAAFDWDRYGGYSPSFEARTGTSMATPHVAAAAALLRQSGIRDPLAIKAVLLNTTDNTGWQSDRGWGFVNLENAHAHGSWFSSAAGPRQFRFFKTAAGAVRSTLTWNRHDAGFNNLDLYLYDAAGSEAAASASKQQNVEQVSAAVAGHGVLKVRSADAVLRGTAREKFGLAISQPAAEAVGPLLALNCSAPPAVQAGGSFNVSCSVSNTGDLPAFGVSARLIAPLGFAAAAPAGFGDVPAGGVSAARNLPLVAASSPGSYSISAAAASTSYGESFTAATAVTVAIPDGIPAAVSASPSSGSGAAQTFTLAYSHSGSSALASASVSFASGGGACTIRYAAATAAFQAAEESAGLCAAVPERSSAKLSGRDLVLTVSVIFQPAFGGPKSILMSATDRAGLSTGWVPRGTWTVPDNAAPTVGPVLPAAGAGSSQTFRFTVSDGNGAADIRTVWIFVTSTFASPGSCLIAYDRGTNSLALAGGDGSAWLPKGEYSNEQCGIEAANVSAEGSELKLDLALAFQPSFAGEKTIYVFATDAGGLGSGWQAAGTWTVPGAE